MFTIKKRLTGLLMASVVLLLILSPMQPAQAMPHFQVAPTITLDPTSGPPGSQVVVRGSGFSTWGFGNIVLHWENTDSPLIGSGPGVSQDGTFTAIATIPPNASPGSHTIIALDNYTYNQASKTFNVAGNNLQAAYIYDTDTSTANDYKSLLERRGMISTTLLALDNVPTADLAPYSLIIIGPDTGSMNDWGNTEAVTRVKRSGKSILGLGEGGYAFFGKLKLHIGYPQGAHGAATDVAPVDLSHAIYQTPYRGFNSPITVYGARTNMVEIYLPESRSNVLRLGRDVQSSSYYPLVQQSSRYFLWGFDGAPTTSEITWQGEQLFVNVIWYMLRYRSDVDTLILADYQRMQDIGYLAADVNTLQTKINTLVGKPKSQSNMVAVVERLNLDTPAALQTARTTWDSNENSVANTNAYVTEIDGYIESLKRGIYPNLQYVILVGAHEVIPMKARDTDDMADHKESSWASGLPQTSGYFYSLYHDPGVYNLGHYLTDSIYGDLSYINNGYGADNELIPELAIGRLVETPNQISTLLDNYIASNGTLSRSDMAAIGSWDYKDGAQAAANHMGASADTALIQNDFNSSLVPPKINARNDIVYIGGHGNYNWMTTGSGQGFMAGATGSQGDTEELGNMPNAVVVASGCHNGVNFGNRLYHDYTNNTTYGEFPERLANKGVGIYLGSTGYTWISGSGSSSNVAHNGWSEKLATHFLKHLLHDGTSVTAGKAYKAAVNEYVSDYGGVGNPHRRVLAIATLYGIPNYRWSSYYVAVPWQPVGYYLQVQWVAGLRATSVWATATATQTITLNITNWSVEPDGLINIPGASYTGDYDEPMLPIVNTSSVLPDGSSILNITWNQAQSEHTTIANDVPLATMAVLTTTVPNPFSYAGFYPPTPYYSHTVSALGGGGVELGLTIAPVQYDPSAHQTRVWTRLVFEVVYDADQSALSVDSDGDGLPDYWESGYGLNPNDDSGNQGASGDPDQDGLTNTQERDLGTHPLDADTDHDGSKDGLEVNWGTDPLNPGSRVIFIYLPFVLKQFTGAALKR